MAGRGGGRERYIYYSAESAVPNYNHSQQTNPITIQQNSPKNSKLLQPSFKLTNCEHSLSLSTIKDHVNIRACPFLRTLVTLQLRKVRSPPSKSATKVRTTDFLRSLGSMKQDANSEYVWQAFSAVTNVAKTLLSEVFYNVSDRKLIS
jgi:hypothetical protein